MPFDWMHAPRHADSDAFRDQHARALAEQAGLLRRLGYDQAAARARCQRNLAWEFECSGEPPLDAKAVKKLVAAVYAR